MTPYATEDCEKDDCPICRTIRERAESPWCWEWIRHLKDFEASQVLAGKERQVHLMVAHTNFEVRHIRSRLAILQTQMPAWTTIDTIQQAAALKAMGFAKEIRKKSLQDKGRNVTRMIFSEKEIQNAKVDIKTAEEGNEEREQLIKKYEILKSFVGTHIFFMLTRLYCQLRKEEEEIKKFSGTDWFNQFEDGIWKSDKSKPENPSITNLLEKQWYSAIYRVKKRQNVQIVGPVGERPLHVCALSAYRFGNVDFEGMGNYLSEGIIQGMMYYISKNHGSEAEQATDSDYQAVLVAKDEKPDNWNEATAQYGKDYCAAVGNFLLLKDKNHEWGRAHMSHEDALTFPPFWKHICKWKRDHMKKRFDALNLCCPHGLNAPQRFSRFLVSKGIYEGETILFFLIAGKAEAAIHELFRLENEVSDATFPRFLQLPADGLFFHPMHRRTLTSFSVIKGWHYYANVRYRDINVESSSKRSYFGLNVLFFAASQGDVAIFDQIFYEMEKASMSTGNEIFGDFKKRTPEIVRKALLDVQDQYGNTLLHVAAWNDKTDIYDRLIELGADAGINNRDGLTPFTLTARMGIWNTFNHIWERHLSQTVWMFGNVERRTSDYTFFDWKGIKTFVTRAEVESCIDSLISIFNKHREDLTFSNPINDLPYDSEEATSLRYKYSIVDKLASSWSKAEACKELRGNIVEWLQKGSEERASATEESEKSISTLDEEDQEDNFDSFDFEEDAEQRSAIRMITLFRPEGWYQQTKDKLEGVILQKWSDGYHLVHLGQSLLPYCSLLLIFGIMWWHRELHVLQHNLWWATPEATVRIQNIPPGQILRNPVVANIPELRILTQSSLTGTEPFRDGRVPEQLFGVESMCGWRAIRDSTSGRLQAVQVIYGVLCLLRLAYSQRRIRPSDWDENEDMTITTDETINFVYLNLEVLLHIVLCGLYIAIGASRVAAGEECADVYVRSEKNSTAIAALFLFINLITVCKPYEGIGLLVLTMYKFLVSDVFNFIIMYSTLFAGFLLTLQTLHNSNRVYLAWLDSSPSIFPQVRAVTNGAAYLVNSNTPDNAEQLQSTHTDMNGCDGYRWPIYSTAQTLLEISFGDGLADALQQARRSDYECAGFRPDPLVAYVLVFWVFLTNVLILNMLIAMMNYTFDRQRRNVHSVWLLDVSYRIMRYERLFPELIDRMQTRRSRYSFWRRKFWQQLFMDALVVLYCYPEAHIWGLSHALYVYAKRKLTRSREPVSWTEEGSNQTCLGDNRNANDGFLETVNALVDKVVNEKERRANKAEKYAWQRAGRKLCNDEGKSKKNLSNFKEMLHKIKGHSLHEKLTAMLKLPDVYGEVKAWRIICSNKNHSQEINSPSSLNIPVLALASSTLVIPQRTNYLPIPIPAPESRAPFTGITVQHHPVQLGVQSEHNMSPRFTKQKLDQFLLVISLICRLDLLMQDFRESCTVSSIHRQSATTEAADKDLNRNEDE